jgi:hypothetical protein
MHVSACPAGFRLTRHACERAWERRITLEAMELVLHHGRLIRRDRYSLMGVPRPATAAPDLWREALGVVVVVASSGWIITVFRCCGRAGR